MVGRVPDTLQLNSAVWSDTGNGTVAGGILSSIQAPSKVNAVQAGYSDTGGPGPFGYSYTLETEVTTGPGPLNSGIVPFLLTLSMKGPCGNVRVWVQGHPTPGFGSVQFPDDDVSAAHDIQPNTTYSVVMTMVDGGIQFDGFGVSLFAPRPFSPGQTDVGVSFALRSDSTMNYVRYSRVDGPPPPTPFSNFWSGFRLTSELP